MSNVDFIIDDFAGPGGWEARLDGILGDIPLVGVEWDKAACETAVAAGLQRVQGDVREVTIPLIQQQIERAMYDKRKKPREVRFGYIASPPCQTFSAAGKGKGRDAMEHLAEAVALVATGYTPAEAIAEVHDEALDERSVLALHPLHVIVATRPEWVLLEQVPTVLPLWQEYAQALSALGYAVRTEVVHAEQYGVPQTRKRAILSATLSGDVAPWPEPTHSRYYPRNKTKLDVGMLPWVSMAEALGWGDSATVTSNYGTGGDARNRGVRSGDEPAATVTSKVDRNVVDFRFVVAAGATGEGTPRPVDCPAPTMTGKGTAYALPSRDDYVGPVTAVEGDTSWVHNRPSPSMVSSFAPDVVAAPGYRKAGDPPRQKTPGSVRISVQQAGVLQSFPADWPWQGTRTKQYQQVGNAVPPLVGRAFIQAVLTTT